MTTPTTPGFAFPFVGPGAPRTEAGRAFLEAEMTERFFLALGQGAEISEDGVAAAIVEIERQAAAEERERLWAAASALPRDDLTGELVLRIHVLALLSPEPK